MLGHSGCSQRRFRLLLHILILLAPLMARSAPVPTLPLPTVDEPKTANSEQTAVLAGGCFWGVQGVFEHVRGVRRVVAGYSGGDQAHAHYNLVSTGTTGHAESVQITFDPQRLSYGEVLRIFFSVVHDPTEFNRQGPDVGTQYRSSIFYANEAQRRIALAYIEQLEKSKVFAHPIVTRVDPLGGFFIAEEVHQDFLLKYPDSPYIVYDDLPKIVNLRQFFQSTTKAARPRLPVATHNPIQLTLRALSTRSGFPRQLLSLHIQRQGGAAPVIAHDVLRDTPHTFRGTSGHCGLDVSKRLDQLATEL